MYCTRYLINTIRKNATLWQCGTVAHCGRQCGTVAHARGGGITRNCTQANFNRRESTVGMFHLGYTHTVAHTFNNIY